MKNKLYYILFVVYFVVAAVVLSVNGVFSKDPVNTVNLLINGGFLLVIGVLFLVSMISFNKLNRCTDELRMMAEKMYKEYRDGNGKSLWTAYQDKKDLFQTESLRLAYNKYRGRVRSLRGKRGYVADCDIEEYINADLVDREGMVFFNAGMPGMLTGLGILGTFLGLSIGLGSFNGNDIYAVTDNVGTLLGGMKVAFHTSVYGILFSLIFTVIYRSLMADAYEKLEIFLASFRQCVIPPSANEDENTATMLLYQANMSTSLKQMLELMKAENQAQIDGVERIVDRFILQMDDRLGGDISQLANAMNMTASTQKVYTENAMKILKAVTALTETQKQTLATLDELAARINDQGNVLFQTCDAMSQEISNQLYTYEQTRGLYEKQQ